VLEGAIVLDVLLPVSRLTFLSECLTSIFESTHKNKIKTNVILVDTAGILSDFDTNLWQSQYVEITKVFSPGASYCEALILGSSQLKNAYVSLMNDDDLVHEDKFVNQLAIIQSDECEVVLGKLIKFPRSRRLGFNFTNYHAYHFKFLGIGPFGANASILMRRTWWDKNRDLHSINTPSWDWIFAMQSYPSARIKYSPRSIYYYRQHELQITKSNLYKRELIEEIAPHLLQFWEKYGCYKVSSELILSYVFPRDFLGERRYSLKEFRAAQLSLKGPELPGSVWLRYQTLARWIAHRLLKSQNFK
jgi:hypothetical protein